MNKKGLSDVVTTVLIILLVVVAVVAVWAFISPTLNNAGTAIDKGQICLNNKVEVLNCVKVNASGQYAYNIAYRAVYSSDSIIEVSQSVVSLENEDGSISEVTRIKSMQNGDSTNLAIKSDKIAEKAVISSEFLLSDGTTKTCTSVPVSCTSSATIGYTSIWGVPIGLTVPSNNWCEGADINRDGKVDNVDDDIIVGCSGEICNKYDLDGDGIWNDDPAGNADRDIFDLRFDQFNGKTCGP